MKEKIITQSLDDIMGDRFGKYSKYIIQDRALPDVRDGLKPVQRRILYAMYKEGNTHQKPYRKSAKTVGNVIGNYHPHGDISVYEAMVRLSQDWKMRMPLIDMQGNNGSIDNDPAAAMRYTEARLSPIALELLKDIDKETVQMALNFDDTEYEPTVLPAKFPNLLVNCATGISSGYATDIPPHNLEEVIDATIYRISHPHCSLDDLMKFMKGPDFPTGATILGNSGIKKAYETGRGTITIRSKASIEEKNGRYQIIFDEVPYGVNTLELKNKVAELVHNKVIDGISDYHSDLKDGIKITITLKRDANPQVVLNNLYKHTSFQISYGIILLMIDQGVPKTLGLKDIISKYIDFQKEVIVRRTQYDLKKAEDRVHILEGLKIALDHIDEVIKIIRGSRTDVEAKEALMSRFGLSEIQSDAILEMRLRRLTGLEKDKIEAELAELLKKIEEYKAILASEKLVLDIIKQELLEIKEKYADERRTNIDMTAIEYIEDESLIPEENIMIALTNKGYIKRTTVDTFKSQNRGGVGVKGMGTNEEDFVEHLLTLSTHDYVLFFTNKGKVYRLKGYEVPEFNRQSKGIPVINLLQIDKDESINSMIKITKDDPAKYLLFATRKGIVKKTAIEEFDNIRTNGKICISLRDSDELIGVRKTTGNDMILLGSSAGRMVKFNEDAVRVMGRTASGVRGINLDNQECIGAEIATDDDKILIVTKKGYGKQTNVRDYRQTSRGSKGVKALNITDKNGTIAAFKLVEDNSDVVVITDTGMLIRLPLQQISTLGRATQGVRLIHLKDDQTVSTISIVSHEETNISEDEASIKKEDE